MDDYARGYAQGRADEQADIERAVMVAAAPIRFSPAGNALIQFGIELCLNRHVGSAGDRDPALRFVPCCEHGWPLARHCPECAAALKELAKSFTGECPHGVPDGSPCFACIKEHADKVEEPEST